MRMPIGTGGTIQIGQVIDFNKEIFGRFVCTGQSYLLTAYCIRVALIVLPDIQKTVAIGVLNRRTENDRAPADTAAIGWRWHNGSPLLRIVSIYCAAAE